MINLSLEFDRLRRAADVPDVIEALRYARRKGVRRGRGGQRAERAGVATRRAPGAIAVGATTDRGARPTTRTRAATSTWWRPAAARTPAHYAGNPSTRAYCEPDLTGRGIFQQTFTSSAALRPAARIRGHVDGGPHVSGIAALIDRTRRLGRRTDPGAVEHHIERTARDLGPAGFDSRYGHGLIDARAAPLSRRR